MLAAVDFLTLHVDVHTSVGFYGSFSLTQSRDILDLKKKTPIVIIKNRRTGLGFVVLYARQREY